MTSIYDTPLYRAIEAAGGVAKLAAAIGVTRQATYGWITRGYVPSERAVQIEALYGIPRAELWDPRLKNVLTGTANEVARGGRVRYQGRPKAAPEQPSADDLV